ncbi:unnamed protein product [Moneuplotes crassus]|uniref:Uncharacterized protein n=1 Tax=Euplotes crassus TaxID=5936 RepID=A0AAD1X1V6_EUPCR|nr:unnamed protein product [Moneuplotes crassus]
MNTDLKLTPSIESRSIPQNYNEEDVKEEESKSLVQSKKSIKTSNKNINDSFQKKSDKGTYSAISSNYSPYKRDGSLNGMDFTAKVVKKTAMLDLNKQINFKKNPDFQLQEEQLMPTDIMGENDQIFDKKQKWQQNSMARPLLVPKTCSVRSSLIHQSIEGKFGSKAKKDYFQKDRRSIDNNSYTSYYGGHLIQLEKKNESQKHGRLNSVSDRSKGFGFQSLNTSFHNGNGGLRPPRNDFMHQKPHSTKFTVREMVDRNNMMIKNIVDLEKEKNKLKWSFAKPTQSNYVAFKDRSAMASFQPGNTIVRQSIARFGNHNPLTSITSKEILENLRDVDSRRDKRLRSHTSQHHPKKSHKRKSKKAKFNDSRRFKSVIQTVEYDKHVEQEKRIEDNSFFLTGQAMGDLVEENHEKPSIPVFKTELQDLRFDKSIRGGSMGNKGSTLKHNTNPRRFKTRLIPHRSKRGMINLKQRDEIESLNDIQIKFFGTSNIFNKESDDKLESYLDLKRTFKRLSVGERMDSKFIPSLHLPQPKDNQYWKSDLDHKLRCLLRVDQNSSDSDHEGL